MKGVLVVILCASWIDYMGAYRVYDPEYPWQTIAYDDDDLNATKEYAAENGYTVIVEGGPAYDKENNRADAYNV